MRLALSLLVAFFTSLRGSPVGPVVVKRGPFGSFSSPNHPYEYADNVRKEWLIQVREGYHIKLRFSSFDLEDSYEEDQGPCVYDYVLVTEGSKVIGRFCGNAREFPWDAPGANDWFFTNGNESRVVFVSDYSNEGISPTGFSAHYVEVDNDECVEMRHKVQNTLEDWDELIFCDHFCNNVPGSYYCSCRTGYTLHSNQHTCIAVGNCINQELTGDQGVIESPDYPNPYAKLTHCSWDIRVRDGLSILLNFNNEFEVEEHDEEGCVYDILEINNGTRKTYCGPVAPNKGLIMDMNTRHVEISFKTDLSVEQKGFRITYNTSRIRCKQALNSPAHGSVATANPKGYYEFEDVVMFECDKGYDVKGVPRLECLSDGNWDHPQPICQIKSCGRPEEFIAIEYSRIVDLNTKRFEYLENITVECDDWYEMIAGSANWRCDDSRKWVRNSRPIAPNPPNDFPKCRPKCGIKGASDNSLIGVHIFGGKESKIHEWPWMVFLNFGQKDLRSVMHSCGGSLISPRYVLTAAHCVNHTDYPGRVRWANETHAWLGVHYRHLNTSNVKYVQTEQIVIHPKYYKSSIWNYDVALIRLRETIVMGESIRPVCLPLSKEEFDMVKPGGVGEVAGWGLYGNSHLSSFKLMHAEFPIVSHDECWGSFQSRSLETRRELPQNFDLTENMFCAGRHQGSQSTCQGDSGGPFVMAKKNSSVYFEVGLVSFGIGKGCGKIISYTGFARINKEIVEWIMEKTNHLEG